MTWLLETLPALAVKSDPAVLNQVAWLLATCPDDAVRDGPRAVTLAMRVCEITGWKSEPEIDTLAAAHAEAGEFDAAVRYAETAVALATEEARKEDEERLKLYHERKPYRDPALAGQHDAPCRFPWVA